MSELPKDYISEPKSWKETAMETSENEVLTLQLFAGLINIEMDSRVMTFTQSEAREIGYELLRLAAMLDTD